MKNLLGLKHLKPAQNYFGHEVLRQLSLGNYFLDSSDFTVQEHFHDINKLRMQYINMKTKEDSFRNFVCNELIEECNIDKSSFYLQGYERNLSITMDIEKLKKHGLINKGSSQMSLTAGLLSYLEPFPFDEELMSSAKARNSHPVTIKFIRDSIEKQYLAWKYKVDLQQVNEILSRFQPCLFTGRSLRNLRRNASILDMIPSIKEESLSKKIYLINQQPFTIQLVLNFCKTLRLFNWDVFSSFGYKILHSPFTHIHFIIKILQSKGFTNRQIQECIPFLNMGLDSFINRMNAILSHPALAQHQKNDGFLSLLQYPTVYFMNLENFSSVPLEELKNSIEMIHTKMKLRRRSQKITIKSIKFHVSNYFAIEKDHLNLIKRHPKYCVISEEQLGSTLRFLKRSGFSKAEILESIIIILYPRRLIAKALKKIEEETKALEQAGFFNGHVSDNTDFFKPGTKLRNKTLQLCLYYMEKQFNFSWDGVLNLNVKEPEEEKS